MTFLNPILAATGLACIAIPILIHILMRRRRRPVAWGAMRFLLAAYRQQRRRMNFEQWLLLAARCLIVALVALAIGKPVVGALGASQGSRARTVYVLLDNSLTSQTTDSPTTTTDAGGELAGLKSRARDLLATLNPGRGDRAALITLAGPARAEVMPPAPDATQVSQFVDRVQAMSSRADVEGAVRMVRQSIAENRDPGNDALVVLLSPLRAGNVDLSRSLEALATGGRPVRVLAAPPAQTPADNVTITRAEPLRPLIITGESAISAGSDATRGAAGGGPDTGSLPVRVELVRSGPSVARTATTQVLVWLWNASGTMETGKSRAQSTTVSWAPGQTTASAFVSTDSRSLSTTGDTLLTVQIGADAIAGDNMYTTPLETVASLRVVLIAPSISAGAGAAGSGNAIDAFSSQDWLALALSPQSPNPLRPMDNAGVRVEVVDPERITQGSDTTRPSPQLVGAGAIVVTQPHLMTAGVWRAVGVAAAHGAMVMVVPPEGEQVHMWTDAMNEALGLAWSVSRETTDLSKVTTNAEGAQLSAASLTTGDDDLLSLVRPELTDLIKPVRVHKVLSLQTAQSVAAATGDNGDRGVARWSTLLSLADGTPLIVSTRAGSGRAGADATAGTPALAHAPQDGSVVVLWLSAPSLSWTSLPAKPLMVPLTQELLRQGVGRSGVRRTAVAGHTFKVASGATELGAVGSSALVRVTAEGAPMEPLREASLWRVRTSDGRTLSMLAVNADAAAGDTTPQRQDDVVRWLGGLSREVTMLEATAPGAGPSQPGSASASISPPRDVPPVSLPLLIAAGAIAALEATLARWFSHARVDTPVAAAAPGGVQS